MTSASPSVSVVVCTRDRLALLRQCLASLQRLWIHDLAAEVLVIDNGSTDGTAEYLRRWVAASGRHRAVTEPEAGLAVARNTALANSDRDVLVFVDDDAIVPAFWARGHLEWYADPDVVAVGGPVQLIWPAGRPRWASPVTEHWWSALHLGDEACEFPTAHGPYGTNMSMRRTAALDVGGFAADLGRKGRSLVSSEEGELFERLRQGGKKLRYDPRLLVMHQVAPSRLRRRWVVRRGLAQGVSNARWEMLARQPSSRALARAGVAEAAHFARQVPRIARGARAGGAGALLNEVSTVLGHAAASAEFERLALRSMRRRRVETAGGDDVGGDDGRAVTGPGALQP